MPQSFSAVRVHLDFSTKHRLPVFQDLDLRGRLHSDLGEIANRLDCPIIRVGGGEDHVHLHFSVPSSGLGLHIPEALLRRQRSGLAEAHCVIGKSDVDWEGEHLGRSTKQRFEEIRSQAGAWERDRVTTTLPS